LRRFLSGRLTAVARLDIGRELVMNIIIEHFSIEDQVLSER